MNARVDKAAPNAFPLFASLDRYLEHHAKSLASRDAAERHVRYMQDFFSAEETVADLTLERQHELEEHLDGKDYSDGYIGRIQTTLKAAINRSWKNGEIAWAPYIRVLNSDEQRDRLLTLKEAAALFNADPPDHLFGFLLLEFCTLARPGALLQAQPFQLDFERRLFDQNPPGRKQTKKFRPVVPIVDTLLPWLEEHRTQRYLVQWFDGQLEPIDSLKSTWRKLRARAAELLRKDDREHPGMEDVIPYTIRHTMATYMRSHGVPEWEVKGWIGHRGKGETDRYAKFDPNYLSVGADAIDHYMHELQPYVKRELVPARPPAALPQTPAGLAPRHLRVVK